MPTVEPGLYIFKRSKKKSGFKGWTFWNDIEARSNHDNATDGDTCTVLGVEEGWALRCIFGGRIMYTSPIESFILVWHRVA